MKPLFLLLAALTLPGCDMLFGDDESGDSTVAKQKAKAFKAVYDAAYATCKAEPMFDELLAFAGRVAGRTAAEEKNATSAKFSQTTNEFVLLYPDAVATRPHCIDFFESDVAAKVPGTTLRVGPVKDAQRMPRIAVLKGRSTLLVAAASAQLSLPPALGATRPRIYTSMVCRRRIRATCRISSVLVHLGTTTPSHTVSSCEVQRQLHQHFRIG